jgi:hypothetical protein
MKTLTQIKAWLNTPSHIKCTLADITELGSQFSNLSSGVLNLSSVAYTDSGTAYDACIIGGLNFSEQLNLDGAASLSFGAINLVNTYGVNDQFLTYIWNRRPIKIYLGDPSWPKSDFVLIFDGLVQDLTTNGEGELTLSLFDKLQWLNDSLTESTLKSLTGYSEAQKTVNGVVTPNETILPIVFGECFNVQPLFVDNGTFGNTGNVYMVHKGLVDNIVEVRDNGVPVEVVKNLNSGTFALTTTPFGTITCDILGDATGSYTNTIPGIISKICTSSSYGTLSTNRFTSSDLNLGTDTRAVGVYINSKTNMLQVCNELAQSINASLISPSVTVNYQTGEISASKLRLVELKVPSGDAVVELNDDYMVVGTLAITEIFPVKPYVKLGYCKNFTTQQTVAAGINPASKFDEEYWYILDQNTTNKTLYRDAGTVQETPTLLITTTDATDEATKRLTLWEKPRKLITATYLPHHLFTQLGDIVTIKSSRFGLSNGELGIVYSINRDWITGMVQIGVLV